ncbi:MAG TPA: 1-deoxy-D-xylulose-5-phosphate reductoisomerase, partial [Solirubrobacteraceae bacterium]
DMRVPISYGLHYPDRVDVPVRPLDLAEVGALTFEPVDTDTFSCLRLARAAGIIGGTAPCTLNAANEVAVHAFLSGELRFLDIARVIDGTLEQLPAGQIHSFDALAQADRDARRVAGELIRARTGA